MSQISYHGSGEGGESDDSEGENQELAQIDRGDATLSLRSLQDDGFDDDDDKTMIMVATIIRMVTTINVNDDGGKIIALPKIMMMMMMTG